jgi:hypothetical protein
MLSAQVENHFFPPKKLYPAAKGIPNNKTRNRSFKANDRKRSTVIPFIYFLFLGLSTGAGSSP